MIPQFRSEQDERAFWENNEALVHFDLSQAKLASFPNLRLTNAQLQIEPPSSALVIKDGR